MSYRKNHFLPCFFSGALLSTGTSSAALEVVTNPGTNTSPTGTVSVITQVINPIPEINVTNQIATVSTVNIGRINNIYVFRSTDNPGVATNTATTQFAFFQNNNGATQFLNGSQAGDDNWVYMTQSANNALVYNGWMQVSITETGFSPILYVHNPDSPTTLITLPEAVAATQGSPRDVQIKSIDFETGVITLHILAAHHNRSMVGDSAHMMRIRFDDTPAAVVSTELRSKEEHL